MRRNCVDLLGCVCIRDDCIRGCLTDNDHNDDDIVDLNSNPNLVREIHQVPNGMNEAQMLVYEFVEHLEDQRGHYDMDIVALAAWSDLHIIIWRRKTHDWYYAVARGRRTGIFTTWAECKASVNGFSRALFKKFDSRTEAEAWIRAQTAGRQ